MDYTWTLLNDMQKIDAVVSAIATKEFQQQLGATTDIMEAEINKASAISHTFH